MSSDQHHVRRVAGASPGRSGSRAGRPSCGRTSPGSASARPMRAAPRSRCAQRSAATGSRASRRLGGERQQFVDGGGAAGGRRRHGQLSRRRFVVLIGSFAGSGGSCGNGRPCSRTRRRPVAGDDAPRAAVPAPGDSHRVFAVVAARLAAAGVLRSCRRRCRRARCGKGPPSLISADVCACLGRQFGDREPVTAALSRRKPKAVANAARRRSGDAASRAWPVSSGRLRPGFRPSGAGGCAVRATASRPPRDGASVSRHWARWVFGKAITSRIDSAPVIMVTMRSRPKARPPCGGAPYLQRVEQEAELEPAASSAPMLSALEHLSPARRRGGYAPSRRRFPSRSAPGRRPWPGTCPDRSPAVPRARPWAGEGVVAGGPALVFLVVFEHREIDHPQRLPGLAVDVALLVADLDAQRAEGVVDDLGLVGAEEDQVAGLRAGALDDGLQRGFVQVLDDRRLQAVFVELGDVVDLDVGQALGAVDA